MTAAVAGWRLQWDIVSHQPDYWMTIATNPLLAIVLLAIVRNAGRDDLLGHAVLAPALLSMWAMSLFISGEVVSSDREFGVLEMTLAAPSAYGLVTLGRILLITTISMLGFLQSWLVALLVFRVAITITHPFAFAAGVALSAVAMAGTAVVMSAFFVRGTQVRRFQNSMSYPFYVLGGIMVPVALLPDWVEPFSRLIFLSWSSDLLRDSLQAGAIDDLLTRLAAIAVLGAGSFAIGTWMMRRMVDRVRATGTVTLT